MFRRTAAALALVAMIAQTGLAYAPFDDCCLPDCEGIVLVEEACCEPVMEGCCEVEVPSTPPSPPAVLPTPANQPQPSNANRPAPPTFREQNPTPSDGPASSAETPVTPQAPTGQTPPTSTPPTSAPAVADPPVTTPPTNNTPATPSPRYPETPPATAPAESEQPADLENAFDAPPTTTPGAGEETAPAEAAPADAGTQPAEEPADAGAGPDEQQPTPPAEQEDAPAEQPESETPEFDELFGPDASHDVLSEPGGWASDATRTWKDVAGRDLAVARLVAATSEHVVLRTADGTSREISFADLGTDDLGFLRRQIEARQTQFAKLAAAKGRFASRNAE